MFGGPGSPGAPGGPPPGFDPNAFSTLPLPFNPTFMDDFINRNPPSNVPVGNALDGLSGFMNQGQAGQPYNPGLPTMPQSPSGPSLGGMGFLGPYQPNMSIGGQPAYGGAPMSQQAFQDWLRMILLGMTAEGR